MRARDLLTEVLRVAGESVDVRLKRAQANLLVGDYGAAKSDATWARPEHNPRPALRGAHS